MRRMRFCGSAALCLAMSAMALTAKALEPHGNLIPQRTDLYSVYSDAYMNPLSAAPENARPIDEPMWNLARRWRYYGGAEFMQLTKSKPANQVLLRLDPGVPGTVDLDDRPLRTPLFGTDDFDFGSSRDGWKVTLGIELSDRDSVDVSFHMLSRMLPDQRVLVAGSPGESTFALEIQNEFNENPGIWFPRFDPGVNDLDAGISRLGENFGAQYTEDQMWGLDILWRHVLDYFEWKGSNWKVSALSGVRVIQTSDNFQLFWNRNTVPGWDPFGNDPVFFVRPVPIETIGPDGEIIPAAFDPAGTSVDGFRMELDVRNLIIGPQFGLQAKRRVYEVFEFDLVGKGGLMANFATVMQDVRRFDGQIIPDPFRSPFEKSETTTAGVVEGQFGLNYYPHPNVMLRIGVEAIYLSKIVSASYQIQPELERQNRPNAKDNAFYIGWVGGAMVKF